MQKLKAVSLYSGADNLGDGVIQAGHEIILCVEMNEDCCKTIKLNHPDTEVINGKVSDYLESLPRADCVIGGPPCPEFSRAKTDRTFDLCEVNNFIKAREITKSKHHFMENVQDLYQVHKERNFLINCADYGVPQTRIRRIFTDLQLPKRTHSKYPSQALFGEPMKKWVSVNDALNLNGFILDNKFGHLDRKSGITSTNKPHKTIDTSPREEFIEDRKTKYFGEKEFRKYSLDKPSHTIITDSREFFISPTGFSKRNAILASRSVDQPCQTTTNANEYQLTDSPVYSTKKKKYENKYKVVRKLVNSELAILQGFRKDFKFYGGKTSVRKQIGNALPAAVSKAFFEKNQ